MPPAAKDTDNGQLAQQCFAGLWHNSCQSRYRRLHVVSQLETKQSPFDKLQSARHAPGKAELLWLEDNFMQLGVAGEG